MSNVILKLTKIVQQVALVDSPAEQVKLIVNSIAQDLAAAVCSLYRMDNNRDMVLLASHGLSNSENIIIPRGKGLVGLVAENRHSVNIANAADHPNYYYIPQTEEERFASFCGAPLVRRGEVIGVLVVQSNLAQALSKENEAFLVTLASQLALIVSNMPVQAYDLKSVNVRAEGVSGSQGVGIGVAQLSIGGQLDDVTDAHCEDIGVALHQWHELLLNVKKEIELERSTLGELLTKSVSDIFDSYLLLLSDHSLIEKVENEIRSGNWIPGALRTTMHYFYEVFRVIDDPYLKARYEDIQHLANKLFSAWKGESAQSSHLSKEPIVLVGSNVSISEIANVPLEQLAGIICFEGSCLSHTAVLANALGVPAVMGIGSLQGLQSGVKIIVDGNEGQVILNPSKVLLKEFKKVISRAKIIKKQLLPLRNLPAQTIDGRVVTLLTNTGLLADISPGLKSGAEGVGLYRTEIPFMVRDSFPSEDEQVLVYQRVLSAYKGKPVYMRTLDIGGDKQLPYFPVNHEVNPALGWRGIRFTLDNIQLLMTQVRAMLRAAELTNNLKILLPMVSSTDEIDIFRALLDDACQQLTEEGYSITYPSIGVMIEVPAAVSQIPFWKSKIDFVSIGSNDLSQYLLAVDRNNYQVANRYDHVHPAVIHEIYRIVLLAKEHQLSLSICGEMVANPVAVVLLLGMGITQLSMSAEKLPKIKWLIRSIEISQAEALLQQALLIDNVEGIKNAVRDSLSFLDAGVLFER